MALTISLRKKPDDEEELLLFPEAAHLHPVKTGHDAEEPWLGGHEEGRLAVDVFETDKELCIKSAIAGVKPEDLEVFVHNDMLTIRGKRTADEESGSRHLVRECHWGSFSRSVILPSEVDVDMIAATLKDGVLIVRMPKKHRSKLVSVKEL